MLTVFNNIKEQVHIERTDPETNAVSTLYQNTDAFIYRGRDSTELGAVVEVSSEFSIILMETSPLDIQVGDEVVRGSGAKLRVVSVDNHYYPNFTLKLQLLGAEQVTA